MALSGLFAPKWKKPCYRLRTFNTGEFHVNHLILLLMKIKTKKTAKSVAPFDYKKIKTFEDACMKEGHDPEILPDVSLMPEHCRKSIIAFFKLIIIFKAINNGWLPDWSNLNQFKYYPSYNFLSSGFGFDDLHYYYTVWNAPVSSRLCTDTSEKALFIAKQFKTEYKDY